MPKKIKLANNVNFNDTAKYIDEISTEYSRKPLFIELAKMLSKYKFPERIIYNFLKKYTYYIEDHNEQTIRTPERVIREGIANCVDAVCFVSALLKSLGIVHIYRMISVDEIKDPSHIYVKTKDYTIDSIKGRDKADPTNMLNNFNREYVFTYKNDYYPSY